MARLGQAGPDPLRTEDIESTAQAITKLVADNPDINTKEGQAMFEAGRCLRLHCEAFVWSYRPVRFSSRVFYPSRQRSSQVFNQYGSLFFEACRGIVPDFTVGTLSAINAAASVALDAFLFSPALEFKELSSVI